METKGILGNLWGIVEKWAQRQRAQQRRPSKHGAKARTPVPERKAHAIRKAARKCANRSRKINRQRGVGG